MAAHPRRRRSTGICGAACSRSTASAASASGWQTRLRRGAQRDRAGLATQYRAHLPGGSAPTWPQDPRRVTAPGAARACLTPADCRTGRTPVVVGAGIAGLAAATGLAERGVASTSWSGRATSAAGSAAGPSSWPTAPTVAMNRGFHAFFRQYYNLRDLLRRSRLRPGDADPVEDYPLIDARGPPRHLPRTAPHPAVECAGFRAAQPHLPAARPGRDIDARAAAPLAAVSVPEIYHRLDDIDADDFLTDINFPEAARHLAFEVFSRSFFADPRDCRRPSWPRCSTSTSSAPRRPGFRRRRANFDTGLWDPLRRIWPARVLRLRTGRPSRP